MHLPGNRDSGKVQEGGGEVEVEHQLIDRLTGFESSLGLGIPSTREVAVGHASGGALSRMKYAKLAIEGELAVELSREPTERDFFGSEVPPCVASVFPVIELHNHVMRGEQPSAGELIANNAIHAGFVAGSGVSRKDAGGDPSLAIFANDRLLEECEGATLIQTIRSSLQWLTKIVRDRGDRLSAGQIVLTGSIPSLISIDEDCHVRVDTSPFGSVEVKFITSPGS